MNTEATQQILDFSFWFNISASITSIILAILAIFFTVYFFIQAKNSEKEVSNYLKKIEVHTEILENITGKQIDRFTKHLTENSYTFANREEIAKMLDKSTGLITFKEQISNGNANRADTIRFIIGSLYYAALTNYYTYMVLPSIENFDENNAFHNTIKNSLNIAFNDINYIQKEIARLNITDQEIEEQGLLNLYNEAKNNWLPLAKDITTAFKRISEIAKNKSQESI